MLILPLGRCQLADFEFTIEFVSCFGQFLWPNNRRPVSRRINCQKERSTHNNKKTHAQKYPPSDCDSTHKQMELFLNVSKRSAKKRHDLQYLLGCWASGRPHIPLGCTGSLLRWCWATPATRPGPAPLQPISKLSWNLFQNPDTVYQVNLRW
jgi:hypothetical protein